MQIYQTLMVDWEAVADKEISHIKANQPQAYKFNLMDNNTRLVIHSSAWHDLGEYHCMEKGGAKLKEFNVFYRPLILYTATETDLKETGDPAETDSIKKYVDALQKLKDPKEAHKLHLLEMGTTGQVAAAWKAWPKISAKKRTDVEWCEAIDKGDTEKAFRGTLNKDIKKLKMDDRHSTVPDYDRGLVYFIVKDINDSDERNLTIVVKNDRGSSFDFLNVLVRDPNNYILPMVILIVVLFCVMIFSVIFFLLDRRRQSRSIRADDDDANGVGGDQKPKSATSTASKGWHNSISETLS